VVAEPIDDYIPQRPIVTDEQCFTKRYPDVIRHEVTAAEVLESQVRLIPLRSVPLYGLD